MTYYSDTIVDKIQYCYYIRTRGSAVHILDMRATELEQAFNNDIYIFKQLPSLCGIV